MPLLLSISAYDCASNKDACYEMSRGSHGLSPLLITNLAASESLVALPGSGSYIRQLTWCDLTIAHSALTIGRMKTRPCLHPFITALLLFTYTLSSAAQSSDHDTRAQWSKDPNGTLVSVSNADIVREGDRVTVTRRASQHPIHAVFANCSVIGISQERKQWWVIPSSSSTSEIEANVALWVLPTDANSKASSWYIHFDRGSAHARSSASTTEIDVDADMLTVSSAEARPHSDVFNHRFAVMLDNSHDLENALAGFYWGTMLPLVVERTMAAHFPYSDGYVLSTLMTSKYAGTYPAVDHEFQIAGRLSMGSQLDLAVVRRMIELQFKVMRDDPEGLFRDPCSVQTDGHREYHIRRNSKDDRQNAAMFPLTGNIEVVGESWHYYEMSKDIAWLRSNIGNLEHAAGWTLAHVDPYGRVWSDVYYEDQVIKDGRETEAQAFAAHSFELLSEMEAHLGRPKAAQRYAAVEKKLAAALILPLPEGYWDQTNQRFVDWIDRRGRVHDHLHLVANTAPVTFGYATPAQSAAVQRIIATNDQEFERFPSFVAAHIEDYDKAEMGIAGPYDLSAAGRYWFWDAAYRQSLRDNTTLLHQLNAVAAEGAKNNYFMDERYDMDHVYYVDGKNAHGAVQYFEYPNVYTAVLISDVLGITKPADADVFIAPHIGNFGTAEFTTPLYDLRYAYGSEGFTLQNLSTARRKFKVNLSALGDAHTHFQPRNLTLKPGSDGDYVLWLAPQQEVHWTSVR